MSYSAFVINSLSSSAYSAGLSYLFGWCNPTAAAVGTLSSKVGQKFFGTITQPFMLSASSEKEKKLTTRDMCALVINVGLTIGSVIATSYVTNYIAKQIDPDYSYYQMSLNEFKVNVVLGIGALVLTLALTSPQEAQEVEITDETTVATPALT